MKNLVLTPRLSPLSGLNSFSDKARKGRKDRRFKKKGSHRQSFGFSSHKRMWLSEGLLTEMKESRETPIVSSDVKDKTSTLEILHASNSRIQNVVSYETNHLAGESQSCNGKMTACTCKFTNHMETLMKRTSLMRRTQSQYYVFLRNSGKLPTRTDSLKAQLYELCLLCEIWAGVLVNNLNNHLWRQGSIQ